MISSLVFCEPLQEGTFSKHNGYYLMSALSKTMSDLAGLNLFHRQGDLRGQKDFCLSPLLPAAFWRGHACRDCHGELSVKKGECWGFRLSFLKDGDFDLFRRTCVGKSFRIGETSFEIISVCLPGDNDMSCRTCVDELRGYAAAKGAEIRFLTPTGFHQDEDLQQIFPSPELFFKSAAKRWESLTDERIIIAGGVQVQSFNLKSDVVNLKGGSYIRGCVGRVKYFWGRLSEEKRRQLTCLALFSFYCGIGYKTTQGMGQVRPVGFL
ncbi:MAG: CRISPR system precrRNA processing endoribonuclease RAMP protein Cas6 [Pyramidobacter sp.]|jgi:CRISPR-associated endoribonuclease Cas6